MSSLSGGDTISLDHTFKVATMQHWLPKGRQKMDQ